VAKRVHDAIMPSPSRTSAVAAAPWWPPRGGGRRAVVAGRQQWPDQQGGVSEAGGADADDHVAERDGPGKLGPEDGRGQQREAGHPDQVARRRRDLMADARRDQRHDQEQTQVYQPERRQPPGRQAFPLTERVPGAAGDDRGPAAAP
jgi:hypothetical protein